MPLLEYKPYAFDFPKPLHTAHGTWTTREGILLKFTQNNHTHYAEFHPIPFFREEPLADALKHLHSLGATLTPDALSTTPQNLPSLHFALESLLHPPQPIADSIRSTALLPAGESALSVLPPLISQGFQHFKWKIALHDPQTEIALLHPLLQHLPPNAKLHLDANAGLSPQDAMLWLAYLESVEGVAYLEQPLPPGMEQETLALAHDFQTPIALDESLTQPNILDLLTQNNWPGLCILKPHLLQSHTTLKAFQEHFPKRCIYSSSFETPIGFHALLQLIAADPNAQTHAHGLATQPNPLPQYSPNHNLNSLEALWQTY